MAVLWPRQNHLVLGVLFLFGLIVFLNVGVALIQVPHLLKMLLGEETVFTRSGLSLFNIDHAHVESNYIDLVPTGTTAPQEFIRSAIIHLRQFQNSRPDTTIVTAAQLP